MCDVYATIISQFSLVFERLEKLVPDDSPVNALLLEIASHVQCIAKRADNLSKAFNVVIGNGKAKRSHTIARLNSFAFWKGWMLLLYSR